MLWEVDWLQTAGKVSGMTQLDLFDGTDLTAPVVARARKSDPSTSHEAADEVERNGTITRHADIIAAYLRKNPGETNAQIAAGCGLSYIQVNKRMKEMETLNIVIRGDAVKCPIHQRSMTRWFAK